MKSKFFIASILIHIIVFSFFSIVPTKNIEKKGEKTPNLTINLTVSTTGNSNKNLAKMTTKKKEIIQKKEIKPVKPKVEKKVEVSKPKPKIQPKPSIKPKLTTAPTKTEKPIKDTKEVEKTTTNDSEPNKDTKLNKDTPTTNDAPLGDKENDKNLVKIQNGQYALKSQKVSGINIVIHNEIQPNYPNLALKMGYRKETIVKVKFLVDKNGRVGEIKFFTKSNYGFEDEVKKALKQWKFEPIIYEGKPTSTYFYKIFNFTPKN